MTKVIVTAQVEDTVSWEQGFRSHADLFRTQTISKPVHFSINEGNEVVICFEPDDLNAYMESMQAPETAQAMAHDGVIRETVKIIVLDKELQV